MTLKRSIGRRDDTPMQTGPARFTCRVLLLSLLMLWFTPMPASCDEPGDWRLTSAYWSVQLENDFFALSGDRYYTNGVDVSRLVAGTGPGWLSGLARRMPFYHLSGEESAVDYSLGQKIFTPEDLDQTALIPDDRPYAGYVFFSAALLSRVYRSEDLQTGNILAVTVGLVGPASGAATVQKYFHEIFDSAIPMGWDNQLKDELGLGLTYTRVWSIIQPGPGSLQFGISPHLTAELGNIYAYGAGGVMFRLGSNLSASFSPPNIRPGFPGISYFTRLPGFNWYLFAGHESRLVFRDIFLDGNTFSDSHSVDRELLVGDHQFGFALQKGKMRLALSNMIRTKEFKTQNELTRYGALNLSFTF